MFILFILILNHTVQAGDSSEYWDQDFFKKNMAMLLQRSDKQQFS